MVLREALLVIRLRPVNWIPEPEAPEQRSCRRPGVPADGFIVKALDGFLAVALALKVG